MKKIKVNIASGNYVKKNFSTNNLIDTRSSQLNQLHIFENNTIQSTGKSPLALIVGSIESYEIIYDKINKRDFANWYYDDDQGLQLINYPTRSIKILNDSDLTFPLNRSLDFLWIKDSSINIEKIASSIVTISAMHGKISLPHPEILSKKYFEQFISTKYLDGKDFNKYQLLINENGLTFDCIYKDSDGYPCCLIQNNANAYDSAISKINIDGIFETEIFNVINFNLLHRNNSLLENLGFKPVSNWFAICENIQKIINNDVYVQGRDMESLKSWRSYLGYPKILTPLNTNIIDPNNSNKKYTFTIFDKYNMAVNIK